MAEQEDLGLAYSCGHTKIITTHREIISEKDLKTNRKDFPHFLANRWGKSGNSDRFYLL